jgi:hypothetical protein
MKLLAKLSSFPIGMIVEFWHGLSRPSDIGVKLPFRLFPSLSRP